MQAIVLHVPLYCRCRLLIGDSFSPLCFYEGTGTVLTIGEILIDRLLLRCTETYFLY